MRRWFNTAGICDPTDHYMLPPERRLPDVRRLIDRKAYFVLHAPRQVGKTTSLMALARALTAEGRYAAVLLSVEVGHPFGDDPGAAEAAILESWRGAVEARLPADLQPPPWPAAGPGGRISAALRAWCRACPRPLVVFLDEIDALVDDALLSVLRQLRDGYSDRPEAFPHALALAGLRDVRDYKVTKAGSGTTLGTASPFNIKSESLTMRNFTAEEVVELYAQHTTDTGQRFEPEAAAVCFELTQGQPWLVNALARQCVEAVVPDVTRPVTVADVERARDILVERQDTHLDSLGERLREERVRGVIEPILAGGLVPGDLPRDDLRYVTDLGLVRDTPGGLAIANPIYAEIIPVTLAYVTRATLPHVEPSWLRADGSLDTRALCEGFLGFWRQHGEPLMRTAPYHEVAPHLVLMAFLHRVVNGGGALEREYAVGSGRMDLLLRWRRPEGEQRLAIELKVWRDGRSDPLGEGLSQLDRYLGRLGLGDGWLVIFDRRAGAAPVEERTTREQAQTPAGRHVTVIRA